VFEEILGILKDQMHNNFWWNFEEDPSLGYSQLHLQIHQNRSHLIDCISIIYDIIYDTATEKAIFQWSLASW